MLTWKSEDRHIPIDLRTIDPISHFSPVFCCM